MRSSLSDDRWLRNSDSASIFSQWLAFSEQRECLDAALRLSRRCQTLLALFPIYLRSVWLDTPRSRPVGIDQRKPIATACRLSLSPVCQRLLFIVPCFLFARSLELPVRETSRRICIFLCLKKPEKQIDSLCNFDFSGILVYRLINKTFKIWILI